MIFVYYKIEIVLYLRAWNILTASLTLEPLNSSSRCQRAVGTWQSLWSLIRTPLISRDLPELSI